jgi:PAS domain S-box-containing protein
VEARTEGLRALQSVHAVSQANQALWFNGVPLLLVAAANLGASVLLGRRQWSERRRAGRAGLAALLVFPVVGVVALVYGVVVVIDKEPFAGHVWLSFAAIVLLGAPAVLALLRPETFLAPAVVDREQAGESETAVARVVAGHDPASVADGLLREAEQLVHAEISGLFLVDTDSRSASGVAGRLNGEELSWFPGVRIDLDNEPSGVATATFEAAPFAVYDASASKIVSPRLVQATGTKSVAFVPLIAHERVIGVLVAGTVSGPHAFESDELALLQRVAGKAAPAFDRARSTSALAEALERERVVARIASKVRSELDIDKVLAVAVEETGKALGVDRCLVRHGAAENELTAQWNVPELEPVPPGGVLTISNLAGRKREPIAIRDVETAPELDDPTLGGLEPLRALHTRAVLAVPIIVFDELLGILALHRTTPAPWTQDEIALTEAVAREVGLALRVASLLRENEQRVAQQTALFRIAELLGEPLALSETLRALSLAATEALAGSFTAVLMPHGARLRLAAGTKLPDSLAATLEHDLPSSADCLRGAAEDRRVLASPDVSRDDRFEPGWRETADAAGYRALLALPVDSPRAERSGLVLVFFESDRLFADEDMELAWRLSDAARGALERSELFEMERTTRALAQQLARTGGALAMALDPAALLEEVVRQAPKLLGADACAVRTLEGEDLVVGAAFGSGAEEAIGARTPATTWLSGDVFQSRSPLAIEDTAADERLREADPIVAADYAAYLGVPLSGPEGAPVGVLAVYSRRERTWRPEEIEALLALAANTSAALANAELYSRVSLEKERSVAILANIADGIVALDREGNVVLWNAAAEAITGVPQEEAIGRTTAQVLRRTLESEDDDAPRRQRLVSILRGGEEVWLSLSEAVMRDPLGAVSGRIFAFRDISADRMVEQVKSDFVAAVSHELRTPLTSIYGFAETLLREDVLFGEEERRTFLGYIASESERLTQIVDELLNVARLDAGDLHVDLGRIDVGSVVSEIVGTTQESGALNGHRFEVDLPDEPLLAEADPEKFRQIFNILVENALQYSPHGGRVIVGARKNADRVEVRVVDEGMGIPASEHERIFRKFYRAESAARDGAAGTGLGLFIAKELVTAMGGRIWVDSTEGQGSSFAFELPAARD